MGLVAEDTADRMGAGRRPKARVAADRHPRAVAAATTVSPATTTTTEETTSTATQSSTRETGTTPAGLSCQLPLAEPAGTCLPGTSTTRTAPATPCTTRRSPPRAAPAAPLG